MRRSWQDFQARTLIVNLKTGTAFRGILWSENRELLVLRNAEMHSQGDTAPVDGDVVIERSNIDFVQAVA